MRVIICIKIILCLVFIEIYIYKIIVVEYILGKNFGNKSYGILVGFGKDSVFLWIN